MSEAGVLFLSLPASKSSEQASQEVAVFSAVYTEFIWTIAESTLEFIRVGRDVPRETGRAVMLDSILVVAGFAFFIIAIAYAVACDRL